MDRSRARVKRLLQELAKAAGWTAAMLLLVPAFGYSQEHVPICNACIQEQTDRITEKINALEQHYHDYRWTEASLRRLYYDYFWEARHQSNDPLSPDTRQRGKIQEKELIELRSFYEKEAARILNHIAALLDELALAHRDLAQCAPQEPFFGQCIEGQYPAVIQGLEDFKSLIDHVVEEERGYRKTVVQASGGRDGRYADDILESPEKHTDFYWRFEAEREAKSFENDTAVMDVFFRMRRFLTQGFDGRSCCYDVYRDR